MKSIHSKTLSEHEELEKQCSLLKTRCHQLESERLPLIAQLKFADKNLRQVKKQQQVQLFIINHRHQHHLILFYNQLKIIINLFHVLFVHQILICVV